MKLHWRRTAGADSRAESAAAAAKELKALRRDSERSGRVTEHNDYGQPGDDLRYAAGAGPTP